MRERSMPVADRVLRNGGVRDEDHQCGEGQSHQYPAFTLSAIGAHARGAM